MEKRYQIFISSTFADLEEERKEVMEAIIELDCFPAGMEMFPASDKEQFEYIKSVIDESDYYVIIVAGRYGSIADDGISYTEKEFNYAEENGIPILAFVKKDIKTISADKTESKPENREKLEKFREKVLSNRMAKFWDTKDDLKYNLHSSLSREMKMNPRVGWIRGNTSADSELYDKIEQLRDERDRFKKMYQELKKDNTKESDKRDDEFWRKLASEFQLDFINEEGETVSYPASIIAIFKIGGIILLREIYVSTFEKMIETMYKKNGELRIQTYSLSNLILRMLALGLIEYNTEPIEEEIIELTQLGKTVLYAQVEL